MLTEVFVGQDNNHKTIYPGKCSISEKAMALLTKYVFAPDAFKGDAALFLYLQLQRRGFNFFGTGGRSESASDHSEYAGWFICAFDESKHIDKNQQQYIVW